VKTFAYHPEAEDEVINALLASHDAAAFRQMIAAALQDIVNGLMTHPLVPRTPARKCSFTKPPYSIIYAEAANEIRVVAFPHHKRRTNYWKSRLRPPP